MRNRAVCLSGGRFMRRPQFGEPAAQDLPRGSRICLPGVSLQHVSVGNLWNRNVVAGYGVCRLRKPSPFHRTCLQASNPDGDTVEKGQKQIFPRTIEATDGSAIVAFAAAGDADMNGEVNVFDLVVINSSAAYGSGAASVWSTGDFNYDGVTNVFDLVATSGTNTFGRGNYRPASALDGGAAAVPEPAFSAAFLAAAAALWAAFGRDRSIRLAVRQKAV